MTTTDQDKRDLASAALDVAASNNITPLAAYFHVYNSTIERQLRQASYLHGPQALVKHDIVRQIIVFIKNNPQCERAAVRRNVFSSSNNNAPSLDAQDKAINAAVQLMCMVDCDALANYSTFFAIDTWRPMSWLDEQPFHDYLMRLFPLTVEKNESLDRALENKALLTARSLVKRLHIQLRPTSSLADHLLLDSTTQALPILYIFHHTTFLKAQLRLSGDFGIDLGFLDSLQRGFLPRRLMIETLTTLQILLFPASDDKSDEALLELAAESGRGFDRDCLIHDRFSTDLDHTELQYMYWRERLRKLYSAVKNPRPRSRLMTWVDEHTSERNALYIAILGLFLAVLFGLFGVIIGIVQTIISYQAWKHPVQQPSG